MRRICDYMRVFLVAGHLNEDDNVRAFAFDGLQSYEEKDLYGLRACRHEERKRRTEYEIPAPKPREVRYLVEWERPPNECYRLCSCGNVVWSSVRGLPNVSEVVCKQFFLTNARLAILRGLTPRSLHTWPYQSTKCLSWPRILAVVPRDQSWASDELESTI